MKQTIRLSFILVASICLFSCSKSDSTVDPGDDDIIVDTIQKDRLFTSRALFEDYTGAWCGFCPQYAHKFEVLAANNPRFIFIANHSDDELQTKHQPKLEDEFGIIAWPEAVMMRNWLSPNKEDVNYFQSNGIITDLSDTVQVQPFLQNPKSIGLSFADGSLSGGRAKGTVKVAFGEDFNEPVYVTILLIESHVELDQKNYYDKSPAGNPYYNLGDPIKDYNQENVLRDAATDILGDAISSASTKNGKIVSRSFDFDLTGFKPENCKIVAFVNGTRSNAVNKGIVNVQWVAAGSNTPFEIVN